MKLMKFKRRAKTKVSSQHQTATNEKKKQTILSNKIHFSNVDNPLSRLWMHSNTINWIMRILNMIVLHCELCQLNAKGAKVTYFNIYTSNWSCAEIWASSHDICFAEIAQTPASWSVWTKFFACTSGHTLPMSSTPWKPHTHTQIAINSPIMRAQSQ